MWTGYITIRLDMAASNKNSKRRTEIGQMSSNKKVYSGSQSVSVSSR
jgi:hypothetical protein